MKAPTVDSVQITGGVQYTPDDFGDYFVFSSVVCLEATATLVVSFATVISGSVVEDEVIRTFTGLPAGYVLEGRLHAILAATSPVQVILTIDAQGVVV